MRHSIRHARRHGQPKCLSRPKRTALYAFLIGVGYGSVILNTAYALPGTPTIVNTGAPSSNATFDTTVLNKLTVTQLVPNLAISWAPSGSGSTPTKAFDILSGETVTFIQPAVTSIAWNQMVCASCAATQIAGTLQTQLSGSPGTVGGKVWLFDPNGIAITSGAVVNVGGLLATSLTGDPVAWLASPNALFTINDGGGATPANGAVTNAGAVTASGTTGYVALVGNSVNNASGGTIDVGFGTVDLAAGRVATVTALVGGGLNFALDQTGANALVNNNAAATYAVANGGSLSGAAVRLTANDAGAVFASGAVNTSGIVRAVQLNNSGGTITLTGIGDPVLVSGTLNAAGATGADPVGATQVTGDSLSFGITGVSGDLSATATTGTIAETGVLSVSGNSSFTTSAAQAGTAIDLSTSTNLLTGSVALNTAGADGAKVKNGQALVFGASAVGGAITAATTVGDITESGAVVEGTAGSFNSAGNINLGTAANNLINPNFTVGGANLAYRDVNSIAMPATTLTGNLTLISDTGTITESGVLSVGGNSSFTTSAAQAGTAIDLSTRTNVLGGTVALNTAATDGAKVKAQALNFAASNVGGAITAQTTTGDITETGAVVEGTAGSFNSAGNINLGTAANNLINPNFTVGGANLAYRDVNSIVIPGTTLSGNLTLVSDTGTITESGILRVTGNSSFTTSAAQAGTAIDVSTSTNVLAGTVALNTAGTDGAKVKSRVLDFAASNVGGAITAQATNGDITESGAVVEGAAGSFNASGNIDLSTAANTLKSPTFTVGGANLAYRDVNAIVMPATTLSGNLTLISDTGTITETGVLNVGGNSSFTTSGATGGTAIDLSTSTNVLGGTVALTTAGTDSAAIKAQALQLAASTVGGGLTATATTGAITETGVLIVGGASSFTTSAAQAGTAIDLSTSTNLLTGPVALNTAGADGAKVTNGRALVLGASTVGGAITATTTVGDITETVSPVVEGVAGTFHAAGNINLGTAANNLKGPSFTAGGGNVAYRDVNAIVMPATTLAGNLTLISDTGAITESGVLNVGGTSSFTTSAAQAGTAIDLSTSTNLLTGAVSLNTAAADGAKVTNGKALVLGASAVGGAIAATTTVGDITETASPVVEGAAGTFHAAGNVNLGTAANNLKSPSFAAGGGNVAYRDVNAIVMPATTLAGNLTLISDTGAITESGVLNVGGTSSFTTSAAQAGTAIDLSTSTNLLTGAVSLNTAAADGAKVTNGKALVLGASAVGGAIAATTTVGDITETASPVVEGAAGTFNAAGNINLGTAANNLKSPSFAAGGGNVSYRDVNAIVMPATTLAGNLTLVSDTGTITQTGGLNVGGNSSFTTSAATGGTAINLSNATNALGGTAALNTAGADGAVIDNAQALKLAASTVGGGLTATATTGTITQTGVLNVAGNSSFTTNAATGGTAIDLSTSTNVLGGTVALNTAGADSAAIKAQALKLAASTVGGGLAATATIGTITETGVLNAGGNSSFTTSATTGGTAIDLSTSTNVLGGTVALNTAGTDNAAIKAQALKLAASTVGGSLAATATTGTITETGVLNVGGNSSFTTSAATGGTAIDLSTSTNLLTGTVVLNTVGADGAKVTNGKALVLGASTVGGAIAATTTVGDITETASPVVEGAAGTFNAAGNINLGTAANNLKNPSLAAGGGNVSYRDVNAIAMPATTLTGNLTLISDTGKITETGVLNVGGNSSFTTSAATGGTAIDLSTSTNVLGGTVALNTAGTDSAAIKAQALKLAASTVGGGLTATATTGTITQTGVLNVGGNSSFTTNAATGGTAIDLSTSTNVLGGTVALNTAGTDNAAIKAQALKLAASTVGGGLAATATTGTITETGVLNASGNSSFTTSAATGGTAIDLSTSTNVLGGTVALNTAGTDSAAIKAQALKLAASTVGGGLTATATTGTITQTGVLNVGGNSSFTTNAATGGTAIDLSTSTNVLGGTVALNTAATDSAAIKAQALKLAASTVGGGLAATATTGTITETGVLNAGGNSSFTTSAATGGTAIDLSTSTNVLGGTVALNTAATDSAAIKAQALKLAASTVGGGLTATATTGTITQTGVLNVGGNSSFTTNAATGGTAIDLSTSTNVLGGTVALTTAGTDGAKIKAQALNLAASNLGGAINATTTGGDLTESGAVLEGAAGSFNASGNVNLGTAANNLKSPTFTAGGGNVSYRDVNAIAMPATTLTGNLTLISDTGKITETGVLNVGGNSSFTTSAATGGTAIDLSTSTNVLGGTVALNTAGTDSAAIKAQALKLAASTVGGGLTATATTGTITQTGVLNVGGNSSFTTNAATGGTAIDLSTSTNVLGGTVALNTAGTDNAAIKAQALKLAASTVGGGLAATATTGTITETGVLNVGGNSSFTTSAATGGTAIDLSTSTNVLGGTVALNTAATDSAAIKAQALKLAASTVGGGLTATATTGTITQTGVLNVGGNSSFTTNAATGGTAIDLSTSTNVLGGTVALNTAGTDSAAITADLTFAASNVGGNLTATATTGTITETGVLNVGGNSSFTTSAATSGTAIDLSTSTNVFGGTVALNTAGAGGAKIKAQALKFAASTVGGAITATTTAGDITESGAVVEGAAGSFNASGNVNLGTAANNLKSPTFTAGGGNLSYRDVNAIVMPATTLSGNLSLVSDTGAITEAGVLNITGTSSFTTSTGGQSIDVSTQSNTFGGPVALATTGTGNASIKAATLNLGTSNVGGKLTATSTSTTLTSSQAGIGESGVVTESGGAVLTAMSGGIDLSSAANSLGGTVTAKATGGAVNLKSGPLSTVQALAGGNVTINSSGAIGSLMALSTGGNITVTAAGAITVDGADAGLGRSSPGDVAISATGALTQAPKNSGSGPFDAANAVQGLVGSDFSVRGNNVTLSSTSLGGLGNFVGVVGNNVVLTVPASQAFFGVVTPTGAQVSKLTLNGATLSSGTIALNPGVLLSSSTAFPALFNIGSDAFQLFVNGSVSGASLGVGSTVAVNNSTAANASATNQASTSSLNGILGSTPDASISLFNIVGLCLPPDQRDDEEAAKQESCVPAKTSDNRLPRSSPYAKKWGSEPSGEFMATNFNLAGTESVNSR